MFKQHRTQILTSQHAHSPRYQNTTLNFFMVSILFLSLKRIFYKSFILYLTEYLYFFDYDFEYAQNILTLFENNKF